MCTQSKEQLVAAQKADKRYAEVHRRIGPVYKPGDKVWLSTKYIHFKNKSLFNPKFISTFVMLKWVNPVAYKLSLPPTLIIHPVFHISRLKLAPNIGYPRPPPILKDGVWEFEVQRIMDSKHLGGEAVVSGILEGLQF